MSGEKQSALPDGFAVENFDRNDDFIKSRIFTIRGVQVMLDSDLARIYQVETRVFNQAVKRNANRFPSDFRFRLEMEEYRSLISQIVTSKNVLGETRGGRQYCAVTKMDAMFIPSIMQRIP